MTSLKRLCSFVWLLLKVKYSLCEAPPLEKVYFLENGIRRYTYRKSHNEVSTDGNVNIVLTTKAINLSKQEDITMDDYENVINSVDTVSSHLESSPNQYDSSESSQDSEILNETSDIDGDLSARQGSIFARNSYDDFEYHGKGKGVSKGKGGATGQGKGKGKGVGSSKGKGKGVGSGKGKGSSKGKGVWTGKGKGSVKGKGMSHSKSSKMKDSGGIPTCRPTSQQTAAPTPTIHLPTSVPETMPPTSLVTRAPTQETSTPTAAPNATLRPTSIIPEMPVTGEPISTPTPTPDRTMAPNGPVEPPTSTQRPTVDGPAEPTIATQSPTVSGPSEPTITTQSPVAEITSAPSSIGTVAIQTESPAETTVEPTFGDTEDVTAIGTPEPSEETEPPANTDSPIETNPPDQTSIPGETDDPNVIGPTIEPTSTGTETGTEAVGTQTPTIIPTTPGTQLSTSAGTEPATTVPIEDNRQRITLIFALTTTGDDISEDDFDVASDLVCAHLNSYFFAFLDENISVNFDFIDCELLRTRNEPGVAELDIAVEVFFFEGGDLITEDEVYTLVFAALNQPSVGDLFLDFTELDQSNPFSTVTALESNVMMEGGRSFTSGVYRAKGHAVKPSSKSSLSPGLIVAVLAVVGFSLTLLAIVFVMRTKRNLITRYRMRSEAKLLIPWEGLPQNDIAQHSCGSKSSSSVSSSSRSSYSWSASRHGHSALSSNQSYRFSQRNDESIHVTNEENEILFDQQGALDANMKNEEENNVFSHPFRVDV